MGFELQTTEKLNNNSEEGYKIQIVRCLFFKKIYVKARREEALAHGVTQQERHRAKPRKSNSGRFIGQRRVGALLPQERSFIVLYANLLGSDGALLALGQGHQVQKLP